MLFRRMLPPGLPQCLNCRYATAIQTVNLPSGTSIRPEVGRECSHKLQVGVR